MLIPNNWFVYINIIVLLIFLFFMISGFRNGFVYELINLVFSIFTCGISIFISPILAEKIKIIDITKFVSGIKAIEAFNLTINSTIWMLILLFLLKFLFMIIRPLFKSLTKLPVLGRINKILGLLLGIVYSVFATVLISVIFSFPIIKNGNEVINHTVLKYSNKVSEYATTYIIKNVNFDIIKNDINDFDSNSARQEMLQWLVKQKIINE